MGTGDGTRSERPAPRSPAGELYGRELAAGALVGEYIIEATLASGGWGSVYRARHRLLGRPAAIKVLHAELAGSRRMAERFLREAQAANAIRHPNIVDIYACGQLPDRRPFFVMELLDGESLSAQLAQHGPLGLDAVAAVIEPICSALAAAHAAGIVHRDVKPANVHANRSADGSWTVKLLDFGIAKRLAPEDDEGLTTTGIHLGTPDAMAPEQIRGRVVDGRTDVYGLGCLLYELLTGRPVFDGSTPDELEELHLHAAPSPPSARGARVSRPIDEVVLRCLEKDPAARFTTAIEVWQALRLALEPGRDADRLELAGLHVEIDLEDADESAMERAYDAIDAIATAAEAAGMAVPLRMGNALLAVIQRNSAAATARVRELADRVLAQLARAVPPARLRVVVHVGAARGSVRADGALALLGGGLLELGSWPLATPGAVVLSDAASADLTALSAATSSK